MRTVVIDVDELIDAYERGDDVHVSARTSSQVDVLLGELTRVRDRMRQDEEAGIVWHPVKPYARARLDLLDPPYITPPDFSDLKAKFSHPRPTGAEKRPQRDAPKNKKRGMRRFRRRSA